MACFVDYVETTKASVAANSSALDALKQLSTLSAGILTLTITFMKEPLSSGVSGMVRYLVPFGWLCLMISIWTSWVAMAEAAKIQGTQLVSRYIFGSGRARYLARIAQWSFLVGLTALGVFAIYTMLFPNKVEILL